MQENHTTASTMSPCCHVLVKRLALIACASDTTSDPVRTMTRTPGHHATNPAKNPQNRPSALVVHTYSEPSSGNMRPSCAVTKAPGIRNVRNPRTQNTYIAEPANCTVDEFDMNRTRATKMTTRSKEFSTLPTRVGATFSETISRSEIVARSLVTSAMEHLPGAPAGGCAQPGLAPPSRGAKCEARRRVAGADMCPVLTLIIPPSRAARHSRVAGQKRGRVSSGSPDGTLTP